MKKQAVVLLSFVATMIILAEVINFLSPKKTYGCIIEFIDTIDQKVLMQVEATCSDDSTDTRHDIWYRTTFNGVDVYTPE